MGKPRIVLDILSLLAIGACVGEIVTTSLNGSTNDSVRMFGLCMAFTPLMLQTIGGAVCDWIERERMQDD